MTLMRLPSAFSPTAKQSDGEYSGCFFNSFQKRRLFRSPAVSLAMLERVEKLLTGVKIVRHHNRESQIKSSSEKILNK